MSMLMHDNYRWFGSLSEEVLKEMLASVTM